MELKLTPSQQLRQKIYRQNNWFDWYGRLSWINNINKNKESFWSWNVVLEIDYYHFQMILQLWGWTSLFAVSQRLMTWKWWVAEILSLKYSLLLKMEFMSSTILAGVEEWNPSNVKIKNGQKQTRKWIWSCSYWWIVFLQFFEQF